MTRLPGRRLAVNLPQVVGRTVAADIARFAARAEAHGFARLWSFDQTLPMVAAVVLEYEPRRAFAGTFHATLWSIVCPAP